MKRFLRLTGAILLVWGCQTVPEPADKSYYISTSDQNYGTRTNSCTFRYKIENWFQRLDNQLQQKAIRTAFDLWQNADPNVLFFQKQDGLVTELIIRFEPLAEVQKDVQKSPIGLIRGDLQTLSDFRRENGTAVISLDSQFDWDTRSLTRVVSYHIGRFLGLENSDEINSIVYPIYVDQDLRLSANDSLELNERYDKPCEGECNSFLPMSLPVGGIVTKSIRIDKQGKITIRASGSMIVGEFLGWSTPQGLAKGLLNIPIGDFSIDRSLWHATLMYRLNGEQKWRGCGEACEFETDGVSQCIDITFGINDKDLTDNDGVYDVVVDYKR